MTHPRYAWLALAAAGVVGATCPDGTMELPEYATRLTTYFGESALYGGFVGGQSEGCDLPVTPRALTFSIWSYIYGHQTSMLLPGSLKPEEMYHLAQSYEASGEWFRSFVGGEDGGNRVAVDALARTECHLAKAAHHACEVEPRAYACCAHTQYHTWVRVAHLLSDLILQAYGERCGSRRVDDATLEATFADRFGALVEALPDAGVDGVARRVARNVFAWGFKGVCENRNGLCPAVTATPERLASLHALAEQTDLAWATALACTPAASPA